MKKKFTLKKNLSFIILFFLFGFFINTENVDSQDQQDTQPPTLITPQTRVEIPGLDFLDNSSGSQAGIVQRTNEGEIILQIPYLPIYLSSIFNYVISAASLLAVIMIIVGGFQWALSGGNSDGISQAKKKIGNAITGLIIALLSYSLLYAIDPKLVRFKSISLIYTSPNLPFIYEGGSGFISQILQGTEIDPSLVPAEEILAIKNKKQLLRGSDCKDKPRTACVISSELAFGLESMGRYFRSLNGKAVLNTNNLISPNPDCPLNTPYTDRQAPITTDVQAISYTGNDALYKAYANCLPFTGGAQILKSIAQIESTQRSEVVNSIGFTGLFQTKPNFCNSALSRYGKDNLCTSEKLKNAEVSTMVGTAMAITSAGFIRKYCPNATDEELAIMIYTGHHNGSGFLEKTLKKTCSTREFCYYSYEFWKSKNKNYNDSTPPNCAKINIK